MPQLHPMPGEIYRHFKNHLYQIIAVATHSETREPYVVYQALYGDFRTYVRPYAMFISEVDHDKYPDVKQKYRFAYVDTTAKLDAEDTKAARTEQTMTNVPQTDAAGTRQTSQENFQQQRQTWRERNLQPQPTWQNETMDIPGVDVRLLAFLDADSYIQKLKIVLDMEEDLDDHLIDQMAASIDLVIEDGKQSQRVQELESCLRNYARFEGRR